MESTKRDTAALPSITRQYPTDKYNEKKQIIRDILTSDKINRSLLDKLGIDFTGKTDKEIKGVLLNIVENGYATTCNITMIKPADIQKLDKLIKELKEETMREQKVSSGNPDKVEVNNDFKIEKKANGMIWYTSRNMYFDRRTDNKEFVNLFDEAIGTMEKFIWLKPGFQLGYFFNEFYNTTENVTAKYLKDKLPLVFQDSNKKEIKYNNQSTNRKKELRNQLIITEFKKIINKYRKKQ